MSRAFPERGSLLAGGWGWTKALPALCPAGSLWSVQIAPGDLSNREGSHPSLTAKKKAPERGFFVFGGERGIRTLEAFRLTRFPGVLLQPLGHLTGRGGFVASPVEGGKLYTSRALKAIAVWGFLVPAASSRTELVWAAWRVFARWQRLAKAFGTEESFSGEMQRSAGEVLARSRHGPVYTEMDIHRQKSFNALSDNNKIFKIMKPTHKNIRP